MLLPEKLPALIAFDWDNTLVDNWAAITHGLNEAFKAYNKPQWSLEQAKASAYRSLRDSFPEWFGADWQAAREIFYAGFAAVHEQTLKIMPSAADLLDYLLIKSQPAAIISNKTNKYLRREVEILGWNKYFRSVVGAGDAPRDKPAPDPMALTRRQAGINVDASVWYIGDMASDLEFAQACGCQPIMVNDQQKFAAPQFDNCLALLAYLKGIG